MQWRQLFSSHSCRACGRKGEFFVRPKGGASAVRHRLKEVKDPFLICSHCVSSPAVQRRLVKMDAQVDLVSITGKAMKGARVPEGPGIRKMVKHVSGV